jgi:hypothetical protein
MHLTWNMCSLKGAVVLRVLERFEDFIILHHRQVVRFCPRRFRQAILWDSRRLCVCR